MMDNEEIGHLAEETLCDSGCRTVRMIACPEAVKALAIGNGEPEEAAFSVPSLSVISLPMEEMAEECLGILVDTLRNVLVEVETHSSQGSLQDSDKDSLQFSSPEILRLEYETKVCARKLPVRMILRESTEKGL